MLGGMILLIIFSLSMFAILLFFLSGLIFGISLSTYNLVHAFGERIVFNHYLTVILSLLMFLFLLNLWSKRSAVKVFCINVGFLLFGLAFFESFLQLQSAIDQPPAEQVQVKNHSPYFAPHKNLGYAPVKNSTIRSTATIGKKMVYDVQYTINEQGYRITAPVQAQHDESILFFGCSVTFGKGLNDPETFPYMVNKGIGKQFNVYNFAFEGYGTHQFYAALDFNLIDPIVHDQPKYAIYTVIPDHIRRIVNLTKWGKYDPRYVLNANDEVEFSGYFGDDSIKNEKKSFFKDTYTYKQLFSKHSLNSRDVDLFLTMTDGAREKLRSKYAACEFHVVFWDDPYEEQWLVEEMLEGLAKKGINVHRISQILPNYLDNPQRYQINPPYEAHPSALANTYISRYITSNIINQ